MINPVFYLPLPYLKQCGPNIRKHRNDARTGLCLWRSNMHFHLSAVLLAIYQIVVDVDDILLKIAIIPPKPKNLPNSGFQWQ